jgi:hypothetical protein
MARYTCKCGEILSNSLVPNDVVLHQFSDKLMNEILRKDNISTVELFGLAKEVWECVKCGRLYLFNDDDKVKKVYIPET